MPPVQSKCSSQRYVKSWEHENIFKGWLKPCVGDSLKAYCLVCKSDLVAHHKSLKAHSNTSKHKQNVERANHIEQIPKISKYTKQSIDVKRKKAELKIAAFVAEHCSINAVDHLSTVVQNLDEESALLKNIKLHRTKCTALIMNVLSPCLLEELIEDIGNSNFSLIIDESTTIDTNKVMCVMVRYFSLSLRKVRTTFYRLIHLDSGTAEHMTQCLMEQLKKDNLNIKNLLGIGVDGANAMVGQNNSVSSKFRELVSHLITVKCVAHSLHLCAECACNMLPKNLDFLVKESQSWFSKSTKRNVEYSELHRVIADSNPKKINKLSGTRWLARLNAIETILDQWDVLELYFNTNRVTDRGEVGFKAETLYQMYRCVENKLYLLFLKYALKDVIVLNKLFQSDKVEPLKLFQDLNNLLYSTLQKIVIPHHLEKADRKDLSNFPFKNHLMPSDSIYFGFYFNSLSKQCSPETLPIIKHRCRDFLIKLAEEIQVRVPDNINILEKISLFAPDVACRQNKEDTTQLATLFQPVCIDIEETIKEWNLIHRLNITDTVSDEFWAKVNETVNAGGDKCFGHISKLALGFLSLPISNAAVERAFSIVNIIKDKIRNRISTATADAILRVRYLLPKTCANFEPTTKILSRFNSEDMYQSEFQEDLLDVFKSIE